MLLLFCALASVRASVLLGNVEVKKWFKNVKKLNLVTLFKLFICV